MAVIPRWTKHICRPLNLNTNALVFTQGDINTPTTQPDPTQFGNVVDNVYSDSFWFKIPDFTYNAISAAGDPQGVLAYEGLYWVTSPMSIYVSMTPGNPLPPNPQPPTLDLSDLTAHVQNGTIIKVTPDRNFNSLPPSVIIPTIGLPNALTYKVLPLQPGMRYDKFDVTKTDLTHTAITNGNWWDQLGIFNEWYASRYDGNYEAVFQEFFEFNPPTPRRELGLFTFPFGPNKDAIKGKSATNKPEHIKGAPFFCEDDESLWVYSGKDDTLQDANHEQGYVKISSFKIPNFVYGKAYALGDVVHGWEDPANSPDGLTGKYLSSGHFRTCSGVFRWSKVDAWDAIPIATELICDGTAQKFDDQNTDPYFFIASNANIDNAFKGIWRRNPTTNPAVSLHIDTTDYKEFLGEWAANDIVRVAPRMTTAELAAMNTFKDIIDNSIPNITNMGLIDNVLPPPFDILPAATLFAGGQTYMNGDHVYWTSGIPLPPPLSPPPPAPPIVPDIFGVYYKCTSDYYKQPSNVVGFDPHWLTEGWVCVADLDDLKATQSYVADMWVTPTATPDDHKSITVHVRKATKTWQGVVVADFEYYMETDESLLLGNTVDPTNPNNLIATKFFNHIHSFETTLPSQYPTAMGDIYFKMVYQTYVDVSANAPRLHRLMIHEMEVRVELKKTFYKDLPTLFTIPNSAISSLPYWEEFKEASNGESINLIFNMGNRFMTSGHLDIAWTASDDCEITATIKNDVYDRGHLFARIQAGQPYIGAVNNPLRSFDLMLPSPYPANLGDIYLKATYQPFIDYTANAPRLHRLMIHELEIIVENKAVLYADTPTTFTIPNSAISSLPYWEEFKEASNGESINLIFNMNGKFLTSGYVDIQWTATDDCEITATLKNDVYDAGVLHALIQAGQPYVGSMPRAVDIYGKTAQFEAACMIPPVDVKHLQIDGQVWSDIQLAGSVWVAYLDNLKDIKYFNALKPDGSPDYQGFVYTGMVFMEYRADVFNVGKGYKLYAEIIDTNPSPPSSPRVTNWAEFDIEDFMLEVPTNLMTSDIVHITGVVSLKNPNVDYEPFVFNTEIFKADINVTSNNPPEFTIQQKIVKVFYGAFSFLAEPMKSTEFSPGSFNISKGSFYINRGENTSGATSEVPIPANAVPLPDAQGNNFYVPYDVGDVDTSEYTPEEVQRLLATTIPLSFINLTGPVLITLESNALMKFEQNAPNIVTARLFLYSSCTSYNLPGMVAEIDAGLGISSNLVEVS